MINSSFKHNVYTQYLPYLMGAILLTGGASLAWWGYQRYVDKNEQAAFKDFAEGIESFNKFISLPQAAKKDAIRLNDLEKAFEISTQKYSNSKLAPFFYLYKADALIQKGDFSTALDTLELAINKVEKDNPLYYLLLTKKALLKSDNDVSKESGLKELDELNLDKNNPFGPMAAYYLGLHYYYNDDIANISKAEEIWRDALNRFSNVRDCSWCELIRSKLNNISS